MNARRILALALVLLCGGVPLAGCGSDDDDAAGGGSGAVPTAEQLDGRSFVATEVEGRELVAGSSVTFGFADGELGLRAGCNSIGGAYEIADGALRFRADPVQTLIGCEQALQRQDEWLRELLTAGVEIGAPDEGTLTLRGDGVTLSLREDAAAGGPPPIVGTLWTLETIADRNGTASSVPAGLDPPTLRFTEDGAAALFAGCNSGGGRADVRDDGFVVFRRLALTEMACDRARDALEATVTAILRGRVALSFEGANLVTARDGRQLVWRAR